MKSFKIAAAAIGASAAIFASGVSAQSGGVLLPITITNASGNVADMGLAADGNPNTIWNSGGAAPQWIDIDLGSERVFSILRMLPAQSPAGMTSHRVYGRNTAGQWFELGFASESTADNRWIEFHNLKEIPIRTIVLQTAQSPSAVAWREFQVFDGGDLAEGCFANQYGAGWAIYATTTHSGCPTTDKTLYRFRDVRNQRQGTKILTCSTFGLDNWKIVNYGPSGGRCTSYQFDEITLMEKK
ncbi:discoidin domain-containing protein [Delftia sp. HK171]|jgi:hypothetical protein|uniref:discoidin domain-containing protein n=1 Tax=Delftia sp. HK171 TaxID=1920191 RepID=UPI0011540A9E|nr:discoidin domain-containing protein [Delftia sp. HK171]TQL87448.1 F5/8 type C domain-containing protein [Delftia sp. HK171]